MVKSQSEMSPTSNLLAVTTGHIRTKLHQFLISSFRDFVPTDTQAQPKTIPARSIAGAQVITEGYLAAYI